MGARSTVSDSDLRSTSIPACAARWLACAVFRLASELSAAVLEIKPCRTSAALLSTWRWAISTCAFAASACSCAWRTRSAYSVDSTRAMTWPASTRSPSRTVRPCNSPGTRALTMAELTAFSAPLMGKPLVSSTTCAVARSMALSSITGSFTGADCACLVACRAAWPRQPSATTAIRASRTSAVFSQRLISSARAPPCRRACRAVSADRASAWPGNRAPAKSAR